MAQIILNVKKEYFIVLLGVILIVGGVLVYVQASHDVTQGWHPATQIDWSVPIVDSVDIDAGLDVQGNVNFQGGLDVGSILGVTGDANVGGDLTVNGEIINSFTLEPTRTVVEEDYFVGGTENSEAGHPGIFLTSSPIVVADNFNPTLTDFDLSFIIGTTGSLLGNPTETGFRTSDSNRFYFTKKSGNTNFWAIRRVGGALTEREFTDFTMVANTWYFMRIEKTSSGINFYIKNLGTGAIEVETMDATFPNTFGNIKIHTGNPAKLDYYRLGVTR